MRACVQGKKGERLPREVFFLKKGRAQCVRQEGKRLGVSPDPAACQEFRDVYQGLCMLFGAEDARTGVTSVRSFCKCLHLTYTELVQASSWGSDVPRIQQYPLARV